MLTSRPIHAYLLRVVLLLIFTIFAGSGFCASTQDVTLNGTPTYIQSLQLTNDTNLDLIIGTQANGVRVLHGSANGVFGALVSPATNASFGTIGGVTNIATGVLNTDGRVDVVVGGDTGTAITVLFDYEAGTPDFSSTIDLTVSSTSNLHTVAIADFDGDGLADIVATSKTDNSAVLFRRTGNGTFAAGKPFGAASPVWVAVGDVNGDGKADIVTAGASINGVSVLQNQSTSGNISFGTARTVAVGANPTFLDLKDVNGDGNLDLVVLVNNAVNVLLGNGDGTFQSAISNPVISGSKNFVIADLTNDNIPDILLVSNIGTNVPSIFLLQGKGDGTFGSATEFQVNGIASFATAGDFNKDGQIDVAATFGAFGASTPTATIRILDPKPTLTALSPDASVVQASTGASVDVTITGTNILSGARVVFNGTTILPTNVTAPTSLSVRIPASLLTKPGKVDVSVFNADASGSGIFSVPKSFTLYPTTVGTFTVVNTADDGEGSLRFALKSARNGDSIVFDPVIFDLTNSDAATVINVLSELPALDDGSVTLDASDRRVTVNGSGAGSANGIVISSSSNTVRGLTIVGFTKSGISVQAGAKNNTIGGSRSTGTGPNGQGLRIANCGAFGIEISGTGTTGNVVKGCWIGLDSAGTSPNANLAGILVQGGAATNTLGGTADGEANAISGNTFEGITFSGTGTDDNTVVGNFVGTAAVSNAAVSGRSVDSIPSRSGVANGSAGVFLSKGTQGSKVGGDTSAEGNAIGNNGGNGIEVRATTTKRNASKSNRISKNQKGGISLFDGSNDGVTPPTADDVTVGATTGTTQKVHVRGSAVRDGIIELFNDPGSQGGTPIGRGSVVGGKFDIEVDSTISEKLTAALTDSNGNTSAFSAITVPGAGGGGGIDPTDADGDGVADALETLAGTDPANPSDKPLDAGVIVLDKTAVALSFSATGKDSIKSTIQLILPQGFLNANTGVNVQFGGVKQNFTLDSKGKSPKGTGTVSLKGGSTLPSASAKAGALTLSIKGDLRTALVATGFANKTTAKEGEPVTVSVALALIVGNNKYLYAGQVPLTYKATQGKSGKAANAK